MRVEPFFARYLEGQRSNTMTTMRYPSDNEDAGQPSKLPGGGQMTTMRYPSDNEDAGQPLKSPAGGQMMTMRYPSDNEDAGQTVKVPGNATTLKFPSDNEDGGSTVKSPDGGFVTLKFPSDNEDGGVNSQPPACGNKDSGAIDKALGQIEKLLQSLLDMLGFGSSQKEQAPAVTLKFPSDQEDNANG